MIYNNDEGKGSEDTNLDNSVISEDTAEQDKNSVADEARIPYSRFESVHERAVRAEAELQLLKQQQAEANQSYEDTDDLPSSWVDLYGDSEESRLAYRKAQELDKQRADKILEQVKNNLESEKKQANSRVEQLNQRFDQAEQKLGKNFSEEELLGIMGIMEEFTPQDEQGNFLSELIDPVKAYEIYEMRNKNTGNGRSQARKQVLKTINGGNSSGTSDTPDYLSETPIRGEWRSKYGAD